MIQVNMHEAKSQLSRLVEKAAEGEEVIIAKAGQPVAKLVPIRGRVEPRLLGAFEGQIRIHPDFDDLPHDIQAVFEGDA
jgi:prevent-host-death family protein